MMAFVFSCSVRHDPSAGVVVVVAPTESRARVILRGLGFIYATELPLRHVGLSFEMTAHMEFISARELE